MFVTSHAARYRHPLKCVAPTCCSLGPLDKDEDPCEPSCFKKQGLPWWLINWSDKDLKKRAEHQDKYEDFSNMPGSALMLGMLTPRSFGIEAEGLEIWYADSMMHEHFGGYQGSGKGAGNRRNNVAEALLNDKDVDATVKQKLQIAWKLCSRAHYVLTKNGECTVRDQWDHTKSIFSMKEPLHDEAWWQDVRRHIEKGTLLPI